MPKIFFIGMPGCGKSHIGKRIAKKYKYHFIDLDDVIVQNTGKTINEIFSSEGEAHFRELEAKWLRNISATEDNFLMATGGGTPCFHQNMDFINKQGISLFINISIKTLAKQLSTKGIDKRPLLKGLNDEALYNELQDKYLKRAEFYNQAKIIVNLDQRKPKKVEDALNKYLGEKSISILPAQKNSEK